jgi:hypothetical protein
VNGRINSNGLLALGLAGAFTATCASGAVLMAESEPQHVFSGVARSVSVKLQSVGTQPVLVDLRWRLLQTTTATTTTIAEPAWRQMELQPGQTVLESIRLDFPPVRAETRFLLHWIEGGSNIIGQTEVFVYPTNLLMQLQALAGDGPLGVFDPADTLKPLLRLQAVPFQDLLEHGTEKFPGKLAMFGPFESKMQMRASLREDIRILAKRGVAVVWLLPPLEPSAPLKPSFYAVRQAGGAVVVAEHSLVMHLAERPEAQLNLVRLVEEALHPTPLVLPETECSNGN